MIHSAFTKGRIYFYLWSMIDGEALQKKGLVVIVYNVGPLILKEFDPGVPPLFYRTTGAMPIKIVALHICFNSPLFRPIARNVVFLLNSQSSTNKSRASCKLHQGSQQEVFYSLMTFGIPTDDLPVNFESQIKKTNHSEMLAMVQKKEELLYAQTSNVTNLPLGLQGLEFVIIPDNLDVLFGKGITYHNRPGNMRLKSLIDDLLPHQSAMKTRAEKVELAQKVVDTVKAGGGRFLSKESGVWMAVQDDASRKKVADLFRNRRKIVMKAAAANSNSNMPNGAVASNSDDVTTTILQHSKQKLPIPVGSNSSSMLFVNGPVAGGPPGKRFKHTI